MSTRTWFHWRPEQSHRRGWGVVFFEALLMIAFASLLFGSAASTAVEHRRIEVSDGARLVSLSDPRISPDGKSIAVVVHRSNMKENRMDTQLVLVDAATGQQRS